MIFVTIGSRMFQFNRLLKEIDLLIEKGMINHSIFAQTGSSTYAPRNYPYKKFLNQDEFNSYINISDIIITHAGVGSIINSLRAGKKVIAVARLKQYQEVIDDHQLEITRKLSQMGVIIGVEDISHLGDAIKNIGSVPLKSFISNHSRIIGLIEDFIGGIR